LFVTATPAQGSAVPEGPFAAEVAAGAALVSDDPEEADTLFADGVAGGEDSLAPQAMSSRIDTIGGIHLWMRVAMVS